ncbi:MAG: amidohydrolase family protein [Chitinispirillaceae bacterium]
MNIIDFHTHVFPDDLAPRAIAQLIENAPVMQNHTDGTMNGLKQSMKQNNISHSVTLSIATKPSQVTAINKTCARNPEKGIFQFGTLHPETENFEEEIDRLVETGIRGIKFHPEYQDFHVDDFRIYPMYESLASSGLIVVFHTGKDPGPFSCDHALPHAIRQVRRDFPRLRMVAAHMGGWMVWDRVEEVLLGEDILFDTSAIYHLMNPETFVRLCRRHGTDRILFGTDSPWYDQGECVRWIEKTRLSDEEKEAVLSGNARRELGLQSAPEVNFTSGME